MMPLAADLWESYIARITQHDPSELVEPPSRRLVLQIDDTRALVMDRFAEVEWVDLNRLAFYLVGFDKPSHAFDWLRD